MDEVALESALYNFVKLGCKVKITSKYIEITFPKPFTEEEWKFIDYMSRKKS